MARIQKVQLFRSSAPRVAGSKEAKAPDASMMLPGEIVLNNIATDPTIYILGADNIVKEFKSWEAVKAWGNQLRNDIMDNPSTVEIDSFKELLRAINNDKDFALTMTNLISQKASNADLQAEITRAKSAEGTMGQQIASEVKRATDFDSTITKTLNDFINTFNSYFVYDKDLEAVKCLKSFYSVGGIAAMGAGPAVAGGGGGIGAIADAVDVAFKDCKAGDLIKYDGTHWVNTRVNIALVDGLQDALDKLVTKEAGKGLSSNDFTPAEKTKLANIQAGAEVNQNAFAGVKVGGTTISAGAESDVFELFAGDNVTLSVVGKQIAIKAKDTIYTHPTTSGNKHLPAGGSAGQMLVWAADGTANWTDTIDCGTY